MRTGQVRCDGAYFVKAVLAALLALAVVDFIPSVARGPWHLPSLLLAVLGFRLLTDLLEPGVRRLFTKRRKPSA